MSRTTKQRTRRIAARLALLPSGLASVITLSILTSSGYALAEGKWVAPVLLVGIAVFGIAYVVCLPIAYALYALASKNTEEQMKGATVAIGVVAAVLMAIGGISMARQSRAESDRRQHAAEANVRTAAARQQHQARQARPSRPVP